MLARPHPLVPPMPGRPHPLVPPLLLRTRMKLLVLVQRAAVAAKVPHAIVLVPLIPPKTRKMPVLPAGRRRPRSHRLDVGAAVAAEVPHAKVLLVLVEGDAMAAVRGPPPLIPPMLTRVSMLP
mmetsp:Transcript_43637/g.115413  ORF Transcript_43637/g.115413 Transcript_43637/m.115413 type:complete len:123 (-) Transcript_43637:545-913(-)